MTKRLKTWSPYVFACSIPLRYIFDGEYVVIGCEWTQYHDFDWFESALSPIGLCPILLEVSYNLQPKMRQMNGLDDKEKDMGETSFFWYWFFLFFWKTKGRLVYTQLLHIKYFIGSFGFRETLNFVVGCHAYILLREIKREPVNCLKHILSRSEPG